MGKVWSSFVICKLSHNHKYNTNEIIKVMLSQRLSQSTPVKVKGQWPLAYCNNMVLLLLCYNTFIVHSAKMEAPVKTGHVYNKH